MAEVQSAVSLSASELQALEAQSNRLGDSALYDAVSNGAIGAKDLARLSPEGRQAVMEAVADTTKVKLEALSRAVGPRNGAPRGAAPAPVVPEGTATESFDAAETEAALGRLDQDLQGLAIDLKNAHGYLWNSDSPAGRQHLAMAAQEISRLSAVFADPAALPESRARWVALLKRHAELTVGAGDEFEAAAAALGAEGVRAAMGALPGLVSQLAPAELVAYVADFHAKMAGNTFQSSAVQAAYGAYARELNRQAYEALSHAGLPADVASTHLLRLARAVSGEGKEATDASLRDPALAARICADLLFGEGGALSKKYDQVPTSDAAVGDLPADPARTVATFAAKAESKFGPGAGTVLLADVGCAGLAPASHLAYGQLPFPDRVGVSTLARMNADFEKLFSGAEYGRAFALRQRYVAAETRRQALAQKLGVDPDAVSAEPDPTGISGAPAGDAAQSLAAFESALAAAESASRRSRSAGRTALASASRLGFAAGAQIGAASVAAGHELSVACQGVREASAAALLDSVDASLRQVNLGVVDFAKTASDLKLTGRDEEIYDLYRDLRGLGFFNVSNAASETCISVAKVAGSVAVTVGVALVALPVGAGALATAGAWALGGAAGAAAARVMRGEGYDDVLDPASEIALAAAAGAALAGVGNVAAGSFKVAGATMSAGRLAANAGVGFTTGMAESGRRAAFGQGFDLKQAALHSAAFSLGFAVLGEFAANPAAALAVRNTTAEAAQAVKSRASAMRGKPASVSEAASGETASKGNSTPKPTETKSTAESAAPAKDAPAKDASGAPADPAKKSDAAATEPTGSAAPTKEAPSAPAEGASGAPATPPSPADVAAGAAALRQQAPEIVESVLQPKGFATRIKGMMGKDDHVTVGGVTIKKAKGGKLEVSKVGESGYASVKEADLLTAFRQKGGSEDEFLFALAKKAEGKAFEGIFGEVEGQEGSFVRAKDGSVKYRKVINGIETFETNPATVESLMKVRVEALKTEAADILANRISMVEKLSQAYKTPADWLRSLSKADQNAARANGAEGWLQKNTWGALKKDLRELKDVWAVEDSNLIVRLFKTGGWAMGVGKGVKGEEGVRQLTGTLVQFAVLEMAGDHIPQNHWLNFALARMSMGRTAVYSGALFAYQYLFGPSDYIPATPAKK